MTTRQTIAAASVIGGSWFFGEVVAGSGGDGTPLAPILPRRPDVLAVYIGARQVIAERRGEWGAPSRVNAAGVAFFDPVTSFGDAAAIESAIVRIAKKLAGDLPSQDLADALHSLGRNTATPSLDRLADAVDRFDRSVKDIKVQVLTDNGMAKPPAEILVASESPGGRSWTELARAAKLGDTMPFAATGPWWSEVRRVFIVLDSFGFESDDTVASLWRETLAAIPDAPATLTRWLATAGKKTAQVGLRAAGAVAHEFLAEFGGTIAAGLLVYAIVRIADGKKASA